MNQTIFLFLFSIFLLITVWWINRTTKKQVKRVLSGERLLDDRGIWYQNTPPLQARVISKKETIRPEAAGIAKVDLELEIQFPQGAPVQVTTCWLVEIPSLPQLEAGNNVQVKFDPKKPKRVFPVVPWARLWLFGK
jgi:hypothetical protein